MPIENKKNKEKVFDRKDEADMSYKIYLLLIISLNRKDIYNKESQNFNVKKRESKEVNREMKESTGSQKNKKAKKEDLSNIKKEDYSELLNEKMENSGLKIKFSDKKFF